MKYIKSIIIKEITHNTYKKGRVIESLQTEIHYKYQKSHLQIVYKHLNICIFDKISENLLQNYDYIFYVH